MTTGELGLDSRQGQRTFGSSDCRPVLGYPQFPIPMVPDSLSWVVKLRGRETASTHHPLPKVKHDWSYTSRRRPRLLVYSSTYTLPAKTDTSKFSIVHMEAVYPSEVLVLMCQNARCHDSECPHHLHLHRHEDREPHALFVVRSSKSTWSSMTQFVGIAQCMIWINRAVDVRRTEQQADAPFWKYFCKEQNCRLSLSGVF
jgi:hypothetical protein